MRHPKISVILPFKNAEPWFEECLNSIQNQTFTDFEVLAVNDGSKDRSTAVLKKFCEEDDRFRDLTNTGTGIINALETAFAEASGEFITRMDADDVMPPDKLQLLLTAAEKHPDYLITGKVRYFSEDTVSEGYKRYEEWLNTRIDQRDHYRHIYRECPVASPNWMMRRKLMEEHGVWNDLNYPEDYHMILKCYAADVPIFGIDNVTHLWREHPYRTSRNSPHYEQRAFFDLKIRFFLEHEREPDRETAIIGTGKKAGHVVRIFNEAGCSYRRFGLTESESVERFDKLKTLKNPQVLIAVYPKQRERQRIIDYLARLNIEDWWFL